MPVCNSGLPWTLYGHVLTKELCSKIFQVVQDMLEAHHSRDPWAIEFSRTLQSAELKRAVSRSLVWLLFRTMQAIPEKSGLPLFFKALF